MGRERVTKEEYENYLSSIDSIGRICSTENWVEFSTGDRSEKEIELRALVNEKVCRGASALDSCICYSYICRFSKLSEEFIKDLIFISSGLFDFNYYDDYHINLTNDIVIAYNKKYNLEEYINELFNNEKDNIHPLYKYKVEKIISDQRKSYKKIIDKLNWYDIYKYQDLSNDFYNKYLCMLMESERVRIFN